MNISVDAEELRSWYISQHDRISLFENYLRQSDLKKTKYLYDEYYGNPDGLTFRSWSQNNALAGVIKESDVACLLEKSVYDGVVRKYVHEPNGKNTHPDFRIWFNDSVSEDDYIDFDVKTYKLRRWQPNEKSSRTQKHPRNAGEQIIINGKYYLRFMCNSAISNFGLMDNDGFMNFLKSYNIYIGYRLNDVPPGFTRNSAYTETGLADAELETISIDFVPPLYNLNPTKAKRNQYNLKKFTTTDTDDIESNRFDLVEDKMNYISNLE